MRSRYEATLRRTVFHSADVAPAMVERYLATIASNRRLRDAREQAIKTDYAPLVRAIPSAYADFALKVLVAPPAARDWSWDPPLRDYGVGRDISLYPATPYQGPFQMLLSRDEASGLRLVHGVTNAAVDGWIEESKRGSVIRAGRTPLPHRMPLPSGTRDFWGDEWVYQWFRPNSNAPHPVCSALMALEVWMEREFDDGRDPLELFETVLAGSRCIAVPGVCLGIALRAPARCFEAALPLLATTALWRFEIPRFVGDQMPTFDVGFLGQHRTEQRLRAARDEATQRKLEIRNLAATYALLRDAGKAAAFRSCTDRLTQELPFCFEDERLDAPFAAGLREQMDRFHLVCDPANYQIERKGSQLVVTVTKPPALEQRDAAAAAALTESTAALELVMWAFRSLESGAPAPSLTVDAALQRARALESPEDAAVLSTGIAQSDHRRLAIVGVAAASLVTDIDAVRRRGDVAWCVSTLAAASVATLTMDLVNRSGLSPFDPLVAVAAGLAALIRHGEAGSVGGDRRGRLRRWLDDALPRLWAWLQPGAARQPTGGALVEARLLRLVAAPDLGVGSAALRGLASAGESGADLLWRGAMLSLAIAVQPRRSRELWAHYEEAERARREGLITEAARGSAHGSRPRVRPSRDGREFLDTERVMMSLRALPLEQLLGEHERRRTLLELVEELMAWTIEANTRPDDDARDSEQEPLEWNDSFLDWAAGLCAHLEPAEVEKYVLAEVRAAWISAPGLTAALQRGYLRHRIGVLEDLPQAAASEWETICGWVLDSPVVSSELQLAHPDRDVGEAVSRIVYVSYGQSMLIDAWPHARRFQPLTERWIACVARFPHAFSSLVTFLAGPGSCFLPEPGLRWLQSALESAGSVSATVGAGDSLAQLLQRLWSQWESAIRRDARSLRSYAYLVDLLVSKGVPLASRLQVELTGRS